MLPTKSLRLLPLVATAALLAQGPHRCASQATGVFANGDCQQPACSADGRFVAFASSASNLVANDTNGNSDVFVRDLATGAIERISVHNNGSQASGVSMFPRITPDGRFVVFTTTASLDTFDSNGTWDIYRHDRTTGQVAFVSCSALGLCGNDRSGLPTISDDGRFVAFDSLASNLAPFDQNGATDVFVKDLTLATVRLASATAGGNSGNYSSYGTALSGNGRYIAFASYATDLVAGDGNGTSDVLVRDLVTDSLNLCSRGPNGVQGNYGSDVLDISGNGSLVLYRSSATNLIAGGTSGVLHQFVSSNVGANTELVTRSTAGAHSDGTSYFGDLSADGRHVVFQTAATNLVAGFGNWWSGMLTVMHRDRVLGTTTAAATDLGGSAPRADCERPAITDDGRYVVFTTSSIDVLEGHNGMTRLVVVADQQPDVPATFVAADAGCTGSLGVPELTRDAETLPWIGSTFRLHGTGMVLGLGLLAIGFTPLPAPLPLDGLGMPGCSLTATVDLTTTLVSAPFAPWTTTFVLPADPAARGLSVWTRALVLDPWANAFGGALSNGAQFTIGG